jgi:hypothetical protein
VSGEKTHRFCSGFGIELIVGFNFSEQAGRPMDILDYRIAAIFVVNLKERNFRKIKLQFFD